MIKFLQKKYKLILLIVATLACVLFSSTVYAWESPNHEQFKSHNLSSLKAQMVELTQKIYILLRVSFLIRYHF